MSRNYEQHPEMFPSSAVTVANYDPNADGSRANAEAELKAVEDAVAEYCNPAITLGEPCDCIQAYGPREQLLADPSCLACGDTGRPSQKTLIAGIDALNCLIDQLASTAGDICTPAKTFLDLAWWHTENAIRQVTGKCSIACKHGKFCACCHHYNELKPIAERLGRSFLMQKVYQQAAEQVTDTLWCRRLDLERFLPALHQEMLSRVRQVNATPTIMSLKS
jgi:hypothetical protein